MITIRFNCGAGGPVFLRPAVVPDVALLGIGTYQLDGPPSHLVVVFETQMGNKILTLHPAKGVL
jgi:hypothetical protein